MTEESAAPPGRPGATLSGGHYRLGRPLTAAVRAGRDEWDDRDVVVVTLAPDGHDPTAGPPAADALTRVARDIRRIAGRPHPGLAPVRDVAAGADRGLWLVHDLAAGVHGIAEGAPVPAREVLRRAQVLAGALGEAHAARVVHGRIGADVVLVGGTETAPADEPDVWLVGTPSGLRPSDRPAAEDDDTRALAAVLAAVPVGAGSDGLAERLAAVLERTTQESPEVAGGLGAAWRRGLRELAPAAPSSEAPARRTEVVPTATAGAAWAPTLPVALEAPSQGGADVRERPTTRVGVLPPGAAMRGTPGAPVVPAQAGRRLAGHPGPPSYGPAAPAGPGPSGPPFPPPPSPPPAPGRPPRRTGLVLLAAGLAVLLLGGVLAAVLISRDEVALAGPIDRVVPAAIGDARTVDPCGLVDPVAVGVRAGGEARIVPDLGRPAACVVDVAAPGGDVAVVATLEPVATSVSAAQEERLGALLVRRAAPQAGSCTRTVVTTEGVQVALDAVVPAGSGADTCAVADAATDSAVRTLQQGTTLPRRAAADPANALTSADSCALLSSADLAAVPGLDPARVVPGVGGWSCRWGTGSTAVDLGVERRRVFAPTTELAGRPAAVTPRERSCDAAVAQRAYTATDGSPRVEILEVSVFGARPTEDLCADAGRLAAATVPRLPPP